MKVVIEDFSYKGIHFDRYVISVSDAKNFDDMTESEAKEMREDVSAALNKFMYD